MGKTQLKNLISLLIIFIIGTPVLSYGQDVDALFKLIELGEQDSAKAMLHKLSYENPGHTGVRYARALLQTDALVAAGLYKDIVRNHRDSQYAPGALMHLGEYYYAQGLYVQSRQFFSRLIRFHPDYPHIVNAVNLSLRAGIASRQMDSVYIDLADVVKRFPNVAFDIPMEIDITRISGTTTKNNPPDMSTAQKLPIRSLGDNLTTENPDTGAFSIQAGAFGTYENARRLADQIESIGYSTEIKERRSNGKNLYLIMVGEYSSRTGAMSVVDMLEAALGIPSFPVEN